MLKKIVLTVLAVVIAVSAAGLAYLYFRSPAMQPASSIRVSMAPERIARGKMIFEHLSDCGGCHSGHDLTRIGLPVDPAKRGTGQVLSDLITGLPGVVVAANLTPDPETGLGAWTDGEKIRAIREGVDRNGRTLFPMMPYTGYRSMSDEDVESLVAYMDSLPRVKNPLPPTKIRFPVNLFVKFVPKPAGKVASPDRTDKLKYGEYLVDAVSGCGGCHTPAEKGQPVPGKEFAGGQVFEAHALGIVRTANITPDSETGIGKWSEDFFVKKFGEYREYALNGPPKTSGRDQFTVMPWLSFSQIPEEDLRAIYTYLRTLKPVYNSVEIHPGRTEHARDLTGRSDSQLQ
jgi:mono/diheme cytochrome c family protein